MSIDNDRDNFSSLVEACLVQMLASNEWLERRILPLSVNQLRWKPCSACWSIAGCLDHLNLTLGYYGPKIEAALETGRHSKRRKGPFRFTEAEEKFLREIEPPALVRMCAPAALLPAAAVDPEQVVDQFPILRKQFANAVRSVAGADPGIAIPDSIHPPVQSVAGVIALVAAHERRHLWQAQRILTAPAFLPHLEAKRSSDDFSGH